MFESYDDILTVPEIAEILKIGRTQVYKMLKSGQIQGFKPGKDWKVSRQALAEYVLSQNQTEKNKR